ncbi:MAG: hypothetical protein Q4B60_09735 [Erysipelotrichaceae bacterium]|nr:hypothetical protein [Erysipelotrichaceae bacterium]
MGSNRNDDGGGLILIFMLIMSLLFLPFIGLYYMAKDEEEDRDAGIAMLVVGVIVWIIVVCCYGK